MTRLSQSNQLPSHNGTTATWKRVLRSVTLKIFLPYAVVVLMLASLQRSLIYVPMRETRIDPGHAGLPAGQVQDIRVETIDGLELHGWHILPDGRRAADRAECDLQLAAGRPLVLYFSGNAGNRRYRIHEIKVLTSLDCDVFLFDYRGYGDNGGSPSEENLAADARIIWKYATEQRQVAPERIVLYGESLGGGVAVRLAADVCDAATPPAGIILRSTFSSLVEAGAFHYPWLPVRLLLVDRYDSADRIPSVTCPILQFHGSRDRIAPIGLGRRLFAAAPNQSSRHIPKRFVKLATAGHNDVVPVAEEEMRRTIGDFLDSRRKTSERDR